MKKNQLITKHFIYAILMVLAALNPLLMKGQAWHNVGSAGFSSGSANAPYLAINSHDVPYVVFADASKSGNASVMRDSSGVWVYVGKQGFTTLSIDYPTMAFDAGGNPYIAFQDGGTSGAVWEYSSGSWSRLGSDFSSGVAYYTSIAINKSNTPYVVYSDYGNSDEPCARKYDGTKWVNVGNFPFDSGAAYYTAMALNSSGTPYVVYQNGSSKANYKCTVRTLTGSSWVQVGKIGISTGGAYYTSIAVDNSGTPWIAFQDASKGFKCTVMNYNGSSWNAVGSTGFTPGQVRGTSIAVDSKGTPYVAFSDSLNSFNATVMKYNGSSWVKVGTAGFSAGATNNVTIALNSGGTPYVAYQDGGNSNKCTVMDFGYGNGINTINDNQALLKIYPNPSNGQFNIDLNTSSAYNSATVEIMNMLGEVVYKEVLPNDKGHILSKIDQHSLPEGIYLVKVQIGNESTTQKIIIK